MAKVLILGNSKLVVFGFRGELIEALVERGHSVYVSFPNGEFGDGEEISKSYGCIFIETKIERRKTNPITDARLIFCYSKMIKKIKPDVVLAYTVKCDTYGGIACRLRKKEFIPNITGLGKGLDEGGIVKKVLVFLYRIALKKARIVYFQNKSDQRFFDNAGIKCVRSKVLPGSGVNLKKYVPLDYPKGDKVVFSYIARVMRAKGIEQFLDAANALHHEAEFHICGFCEEDYKERISEEEEKGVIVYHGLVDNVVDYERISHCIVLPTFHPEGISNVLLEAAASARPIITTNRVGCKETVEDGVTGFLVEEKNSSDLIDKMKRFMMMNPLQRELMGKKGREKMEMEFDRQIVVDEYINEIEGIK